MVERLNWKSNLDMFFKLFTLRIFVCRTKDTHSSGTKRQEGKAFVGIISRMKSILEYKTED